MCNSNEPVYEWTITIYHWDTYGTKILSQTPAVILGAKRAEVTHKVRTMMEAKYDNMREFWSHTWSFNNIREVKPHRCPVGPNDYLIDS